MRAIRIVTGCACALTCLFAIALLAGPAHADKVVTSAKVKSRLNVRARPTSTSAVVGKLEPGEPARWVSDMPHWHRVRLGDGTYGYVAKEWSKRIESPAEFTVDVADVGTGLGVLVRGKDFSLIYDAGSNDDTALGGSNRFLAFMKARAPNLKNIDYIVVSHPHPGHVELLPDVFTRYRVLHVFDPGLVNPICGYHRLLKSISEESGIEYRSAHAEAGERTINFGTSRTCYGEELPKAIALHHGDQIESDRTVTLGDHASMRVLYADGSRRQSFDENSLVVRLDLGERRVLLMGDAGAGRREEPEEEASPISIEGKLLAWRSDELDADVLVVGNHGSKTSSRSEFLDAVDAGIFVVSAGPMPYDDVVLPDAAVIRELEARGEVFRTDFSDPSCLGDPSKIGPDADGKPGGCDNIVVEITTDGEVRADYWRHAD